MRISPAPSYLVRTRRRGNRCESLLERDRAPRQRAVEGHYGEDLRLDALEDEVRSGPARRSASISAAASLSIASVVEVLRLMSSRALERDDQHPLGLFNLATQGLSRPRPNG